MKQEFLEDFDDDDNEETTPKPKAKKGERNRNPKKAHASQLNRFKYGRIYNEARAQPGIWTQAKWQELKDTYIIPMDEPSVKTFGLWATKMGDLVDDASWLPSTALQTLVKEEIDVFPVDVRKEAIQAIREFLEAHPRSTREEITTKTKNILQHVNEERNKKIKADAEREKKSHLRVVEEEHSTQSTNAYIHAEISQAIEEFTAKMKNLEANLTQTTRTDTEE